MTSVQAGYNWAEATRRWQGDLPTLALWRADLKVPAIFGLKITVVVVVVIGFTTAGLAGFLALGSQPVQYAQVGPHEVEFTGVVSAQTGDAARRALGQAVAKQLKLEV